MSDKNAIAAINADETLTALAEASRQYERYLNVVAAAGGVHSESPKVPNWNQPLGLVLHSS